MRYYLRSSAVLGLEQRMKSARRGSSKGSVRGSLRCSFLRIGSPSGMELCRI